MSSSPPSPSSLVLSALGKRPQSFHWGFFQPCQLVSSMRTNQKVNLFLFPKSSFHGSRNPDTTEACLLLYQRLSHQLCLGYAKGYAQGYASSSTLLHPWLCLWLCPQYLGHSCDSLQSSLMIFFGVVWFVLSRFFQHYWWCHHLSFDVFWECLFFLFFSLLSFYQILCLTIL